VWVLGSIIAFSIGMVVFGLATLNSQDATGEVLTKHRVFAGLRFGRGSQHRAAPAASTPSSQVWQRPSGHREEFMTMIISEKAQAIADKVMQDLRRGVNALHGEGMYTQKPREVLMCALTETGRDSLKNAAREIDPHGFVNVMPASEISGAGFQSLEA
jgi:Uncharacterized protein conserved in bacteria (DUF2179)